MKIFVKRLIILIIELDLQILYDYLHFIDMGIWIPDDLKSYLIAMILYHFYFSILFVLLLFLHFARLIMLLVHINFFNLAQSPMNDNDIFSHLHFTNFYKRNHLSTLFIDSYVF